jgi:hypothetical protein
MYEAFLEPDKKKLKTVKIDEENAYLAIFKEAF